MFYLHMYDRRLPMHENQSCQDCNRYDRRNQLCTFEADYFTHVDGYSLTCPFQTESRVVTRYDFPTTDNGDWYTNNNLNRNGGAVGRASNYATEHARRPGYSATTAQ